MTDYKTEYAAFRADVLSRVLPMPVAVTYRHNEQWKRAMEQTKREMNASYLLSQGKSAKEIVDYWLEWDKARDAVFVHGLKTKFPNLHQ